jgi:ParB-like chromosome segregation protein Spo0J
MRTLTIVIRKDRQRSMQGHSEQSSVAVDDIVVDATFQARLGLDERWVADLATVMEAEPDAVPPITLYRIAEGPYAGQLVVVDGFHRLAAARRLGWTHIRATVTRGSAAEALDAAAVANAAALQKPLRPKERRRLVVTMARRHPE